MNKLIFTIYIIIFSLSVQGSIFDEAWQDYEKFSLKKNRPLLDYVEDLSSRIQEAHTKKLEHNFQILINYYNITVSTGLKYGINYNASQIEVNRLLKTVQSIYRDIDWDFSINRLTESMKGSYIVAEDKGTLSQFYALFEQAYTYAVFEKKCPSNLAKKTNQFTKTSPTLSWFTYQVRTYEKDVEYSKKIYLTKTNSGISIPPTDWLLAKFYPDSSYRATSNLSQNDKKYLGPLVTDFTEKVLKAEFQTPSDFYTFYHGIGSMRLFYDIQSLLANKGRELKEVVLRSDSDPSFSTVDDFLRIIGRGTSLNCCKRIFNSPLNFFGAVKVDDDDPQSWFDHQPSIRKHLMSVNFSLFDGRPVLGESALDFFMGRRNVQVNVENVLDTLKIRAEKKKKCLALLNKYPEISHALLKIDIHESVLNKIVYLCLPLGEPVTNSSEKYRKENDITNTQYDDWTTRYKETKEFLEAYKQGFKNALEFAREKLYHTFEQALRTHSTAQARILVTSPLIRYGENLRTTIFNHPKISLETVQSYYSELQAILDS